MSLSARCKITNRLFTTEDTEDQTGLKTANSSASSVPSVVERLILQRAFSATLSLLATRTRPETTAQANDSERRVASVSREIASKAPRSPQVGH